MKRIITLLLSVAIIFSFIVPVSAATTYDWTDSSTGITWRYQDGAINGGIKLVGSYADKVDGAARVYNEVIVPTTIDSKTVTFIAGAFFYSTKYDPRSTVGYTDFYAKTIVIPDTVVTIGAGAIRNQTALTSITIPSSVSTLGAQVFMGDNKLETVVFEDGIGITTLENETFRDCTKLSSVNIPDSVTSISTNVFYSCGSITNITIPASVTSINSSAFYNGPKVITFEGTTAPTITYNSTKLCFSNSTTVYYPEGASGYTDPTFQSNFKAGTSFIPVAPPTIIDEINDGDDVTFDDDFDADGATATMTAGQIVDIGTYTLSNATINVGSGTLIVNGTTVTGTVEFDEYGKILVANGDTSYLSKGTSQGMLTSFIHDGSATIDYTVTRSSDSRSKDVAVSADGIANGSRVIFGLSFNNIPAGTTLTFIKK